MTEITQKHADASTLHKAHPTLPTDSAPVVASDGARNAQLQYLRGFAALAVLLFHVSSYVNQLRGDRRYLDIFSGFWGVYGVAVFFVLSGYLMAKLIARDTPARFLLERVLRIYPLMLIVLAAAALAFLATGFGRRPDFVAMTLVPVGPRDYFLGIEWTLLFEMTYYVLIAAMAMLGLRRWIAPLFGLWLGALLVVTLLGYPRTEILTPPLTQLPGHLANTAFLMGFLLPVVLKAKWLPPGQILWLLALPVAALSLVLPETYDRWIAGLSAALLVAGALRTSGSSPQGVLGRAGMRLGDASYALYLCHVPVIVASGNLVPDWVPAWALWIGWASSALAVSLCLGPLDLNLHRRLKRWAASLPAQRVTRASLIFLVAFAAIAGYFDISSRISQRAEDAARVALAKTQPQALPSVLAAVDSTALLPDGRLVVRGYGIDLATPDDDGHVALQQNGAVIAVDRMKRMRPQIARQVSRPDLESIRFGFSVVSPLALDCSKGPLEARFVLPDGRVTAIASEELEKLCKPGAAPRAP